MKSSTPLPPENISEYVERILVIEHYSVTTPFTLPLFANGAPTLLFQTAKGQIKNNSNYLTLFGQTVFPETLTINENFTLIAYFFKPYALFSLFGVSPEELTDNPINLNLLSAQRTKELQEELLNAASTQAMKDIIDRYIFSLITKIKTDLQLIRFATTKIAHDPSKTSLRAVQDELCLTERTFQRMFEKYVGLSPNQYRRIAQFNLAFQRLNQRKFHNLTDVAFAHGYADQSHYIRAFKEFTHLTPKQYLNFGKA